MSASWHRIRVPRETVNSGWNMYRDIPISQRVDRIGEILAKGVYLYLKKEKMTAKAAPRGKQAILPSNRVKNKVEKINRTI